jgi:Polysaccharide lyase
MSRLFSNLVAVILVTTVAYGDVGASAGMSAIQAPIAPEDALIEAHDPATVMRSTDKSHDPGRSAGGGIPASACWKYDSATIDATEVSRWNVLATQWDASRSRPHKITWFDDDQQSIKFHHSYTNQTPMMTSSGLLTPTYRPGDIEKHTMVEMYGGKEGEACSAHIKTSRTILEGKRYRVGFDIFIPIEAGSWNERFLAIQLHNPRLRNPPISFHFDGTSGNAFELILRGDDRHPDDWDGKHQFMDRVKLATDVHGKWHHVEFEFVLDRFGAQGECTLWLDGAEVYDSRKKFGGPIKLSYFGDTYMPVLGIYATKKSKVTLSGVLYDKMWFMAL